jgi:hypothetical protein
MKITVSGGLVRIAGDAEVAANEALAESLPVDETRRTDVTAGWDPYQVWLTRVKAPREARDQELSEPTP